MHNNTMNKSPWQVLLQSNFEHTLHIFKCEASDHEDAVDQAIKDFDYREGGYSIICSSSGSIILANDDNNMPTDVEDWPTYSPSDE